MDDPRPSNDERSPARSTLQPPTNFWKNNDVIPILDIADQSTASETKKREIGEISFVEWPEAGNVIRYGNDASRRSHFLRNPYYPFANAEDFNLAQWFIESGTPQIHINSFFKGSPKGLDPSTERHFTSSYKLNQCIDAMPDGMGWDSWKDVTLPDVTWNDKSTEPISFFYRDPVECIKYLLRQPMFAGRLHYAPRRRFNDGERLYTEMHTADWWWETQKTLPPGAALVPVIAMSDATHLSNFSGDLKAWPVYMTIGNIEREVRCSPSSTAVVLLALLPVAHKLQLVNMKNRKIQSEKNRYVLAKVMSVIMQSLKDVGHLGMDALCADNAVRLCFPRLALWIADYPEHCTLHGLKSGHCMWCETPSKDLANNESCAKYPPRNHTRYSQQWIDKDFKSLTDVGINTTENILWWLPGVQLETMAVPDMLHTIYIGMVEHIMTWCTSFLREYGRMEIFDSIWKSLPAYDTLTKPTKSYSEVSQWGGKDMRRFLKYLLPTFTAALRRPMDAHRQTFRNAISCVRLFTEFVYYGQYDSHTKDTLQYMDDVLHRFYDLVEVFAPHKKSKKLAASIDQLMKGLRAERDEEIAQAKANGAIPRELTEIAASHKLFMDSSAIEYMKANVNFSFPKMHLMRHFTEAIRLFGTLQQHSTEVLELNHQFQLKKGYRASNKNKNYVTQILNYNARKDAFAVRRHNLDTLRRMADATESGHEDFAEESDLESIIAVKPTLTYSGMSPKREVSIFKDLVKFCPNVLDTDLYGCVMEIPVLASRFTDESRLWQAPTSRFVTVEIPVRHFSTIEWQVQKARSTGNETWHGGAPRNDWVWLNYNDDHIYPDAFTKRRTATRKGHDKAHRGRKGSRTGPLYGALRGRLPAQLVCLFKVADPTGDVWHLALVRATTAYQSGAVDSASGLVRVVKRTGGVQGDLRIVLASRIDGCAHLVPEDPGPDNKIWWVNCMIDLTTWNTVYNYEEDGYDGD